MATFLKISTAVLALLAVHLTLADDSYPDVGKSLISTDAAESRSDVKIPEELSHLKPGESLYFYYEPIQNQKYPAHPSHYGHQRRRHEAPFQQQQKHHPQQQQIQQLEPRQQQQQQQQQQKQQQQQQQQQLQPQQQQPQFQRNSYNPYRQRVGRPYGLVDRIRNMFSFNPFWRNQISRQLEVVAASPLIAGAVVAGITALAGGLVYTQGILSEPAPVVTPAPAISNFRPAVTTRVVNRIVSAIENQASNNPVPDRYSARPLSDDEITTTTPSPAIGEDESNAEASEADIRFSSINESTTTPSEEDTTIDETTMAAQSTTDLVDAILGVAQGSEDNEVDNNLLGAGNGSSLDSESDNIVRLGNGDVENQAQDEGSDDSTESMMETTTGMPDTTAKILKLTMQKASSLYPDMILLPLTQGDSNDPAGTTTMIPDASVKDDTNEGIGLPITTTPRPVEDSENDVTTIKAPERVKFGSSDQVIDYIKQLTNNIIDEDPSKPNNNGEERSQPDLLPSGNSSSNNPEGGDVVTEALEASNIFDRISLNAEAKKEAEEAENNPTTIANSQGKDEDKIPQYSSWTEWTDCSALCTNDFSDTPPTQKRSRTCLNNCQLNQFIAEYESQSCNLRTNCDSLLTSPDLEAPLINRMTDALDSEGRPYSPKIIFGPEYDGIEFLNGLSSTFAPAISYPLRTDLSVPSDLTLMTWLYLNQTQVSEEYKSLPLISLAPKGSMDQGLSLVLLGPDRTLGLELVDQEAQIFDSNQSVPKNQWTHVGVTHNANTGLMQFYLDGQRMGVPIQSSIEGVQFKMSKLMLKPESHLNLAMVNFYQEVLPSELIHTLFHKMKLQERSKLFLTDTI